MKKHINRFKNKNILSLLIPAIAMIIIFTSVSPMNTARSAGTSACAAEGCAEPEGCATGGCAAEGCAEPGCGEISRIRTADDASCPPEYLEIVKHQRPEFLQCKYYNEKDFMNSVMSVVKQDALAASAAAVSPEAAVPASAAAVSQTGGVPASERPEAAASPTVGGIVPHHLLAANMIAGFFEAISQNPPDTVVVIAPNHRRVGLKGIHTSTLGWCTPFGILEPDQTLSEMLVNDIGASQNTLLMEEEHSISSLVPHIKYYLPNAKIVPVLLHGNYPLKEAQELGKILADEMCNEGSKIIAIASVDFSHYLDAQTANKMDKDTLEAIKAFDIEAISAMGNDNLDSPPSIIALLSAMEQVGAGNAEVMAHDNSSNVTKSGYDYTTSYYTIFFNTK